MSVDPTVQELNSDSETRQEIDDQDAQANGDLPSAGDSSEASSNGRQSERKKRHVRLFCFSCNRYEGHSIGSKHRFFYSFLLGLTFGLYFYLGRYLCHCCGNVRLGRYDWINPRFWFRAIRERGGGSKRKRKVRKKSKRQ